MAELHRRLSGAPQAMMAKLIDDLFKDRIAHQTQALAILRSRVRPAMESENRRSTFLKSAGRFLARGASYRLDPFHPTTMPPWTAMPLLIPSLTARERARDLRLSRAKPRQAIHSRPFRRRECPFRIFTGAVMPSGLGAAAAGEKARNRTDGRGIWLGGYSPWSKTRGQWETRWRGLGGRRRARGHRDRTPAAGSGDRSRNRA